MHFPVIERRIKPVAKTSVFFIFVEKANHVATSFHPYASVSYSFLKPVFLHGFQKFLRDWVTGTFPYHGINATKWADCSTYSVISPFLYLLWIKNL
jgi:hypothetical protein